MRGKRLTNSNIFDCKKVFIVGPVPQKEVSRALLEQKRSEGYSIVSFSCSSLIFLYDIGFVPDFHTFIDPQSYCRVVLKTGYLFLNEICFIGPKILNLENLFESNIRIYNNPHGGISGFMSNQRFLSIYKNNAPINTYKKYFSSHPYIIDCSIHKSNRVVDFKQKFYRIKNGRGEIDKLTYFLLPLIFFWFKSLKRLHITGFGYFRQPRYKGGDSSSYSKYLEAYKNIFPLYRKINFGTDVSVSISKSSNFSALGLAIEGKLKYKKTEKKIKDCLTTPRLQPQGPVKMRETKTPTKPNGNTPSGMKGLKKAKKKSAHTT